MAYTRREFGRLALSGIPAAAFLTHGESLAARLAQKPNSVIDGVPIGVITYSYRNMPDQSGEATLKYILDSGLSGAELMDRPAEVFAGAPGIAAVNPPPAPRGSGRGGGRAELTPEQRADREERARTLKEWRSTVSMDRFKALRQMYNDAGVTIYAYKSDGMTKNLQTSDAELDYVFRVASTLGATHTTMELPSGPDAEALLKRMASFARRHKVYVAYHTHTQGSMTAFDQVWAVAPAVSRANVDFGHYVAGGNVGGTTVEFLKKFHDRIASFHLKDRTTPEHGAKTTPFGEGDLPIRDLLQTLKQNNWKIPATIELEYAIPDGSDAPREVRKCLDYCRAALA
jgi:sugar phosphate isomerase/epimerase